MIQGLIDGITSKVTGAVDAIKEVASNVASAFTQYNQIKSPSRLYRGFGYRLPEGAALGVLDGIKLVKSAMSTMATKMAVTVDNEKDTSNALIGQVPAIQIPEIRKSSENNSSANSSGSFTFAPNININVGSGSGAKEVVGDLEREIDAWMERYIKKLGLRNPAQFA